MVDNVLPARNKSKVSRHITGVQIKKMQKRIFILAIFEHKILIISAINPEKPDFKRFLPCGTFFAQTAPYILPKQ